VKTRYIVDRYIDSYRPGDDITGQYPQDIIDSFVERGLAHEEEPELDELPLGELRSVAEQAGVEYYWTKSAETLIAELQGADEEE